MSGGNVKTTTSYSKIPTAGSSMEAIGPCTTDNNSSKKTRPAPSTNSTAQVATAITGTSDSSIPSVAPPLGHSQSFLDSIFLHLAEAREELEQLAEVKNNGLASSGSQAMATVAMGSVVGGGDALPGTPSPVGEAEEEAVRVRLRRCLGLLQGVIRSASGTMSPAHAHRGMGMPGEVLVKVGPRGTGAGISSSSSSSLVAGAGDGVLPHPLPSKYLLEVHPLETVGSVRARLATANGSGVDYTRMAANGKTLGIDWYTCQESGIGHKVILITIVTPSNQKFGGAQAQVTRANEDAKRRRAELTRHEGDVIAMQDEPFNELFRLLECAHGLQVKSYGSDGVVRVLFVS